MEILSEGCRIEASSLGRDRGKGEAEMAECNLWVSAPVHSLKCCAAGDLSTSSLKDRVVLRHDSTQ